MLLPCRLRPGPCFRFRPGRQRQKRGPGPMAGRAAQQGGLAGHMKPASCKRSLTQMYGSVSSVLVEISLLDQAVYSLELP